MATIYVYLIDEAVDVWRPVPAERIADDVYVIDPSTSVPEGETWSFQPGQRVRCRWRKFAEGEGFEAVEVAG